MRRTVGDWLATRFVEYRHLQGEYPTAELIPVLQGEQSLRVPFFGGRMVSGSPTLGVAFVRAYGSEGVHQLALVVRQWVKRSLGRTKGKREYAKFFATLPDSLSKEEREAAGMFSDAPALLATSYFLIPALDDPPVTTPQHLTEIQGNYGLVTQGVYNDAVTTLKNHATFWNRAPKLIPQEVLFTLPSPIDDEGEGRPKGARNNDWMTHYVEQVGEHGMPYAQAEAESWEKMQTSPIYASQADHNTAFYHRHYRRYRQKKT
ncbi:MAG: hypothetical protein H7Y38_14905 [Armatimonadetes bacterium]|nr:hypothetical protein [Armatimonadota bacterium]